MKFLNYEGLQRFWGKAKDYIAGQLAGYVAKEEGKGLSSNDFTNAQVEKLAGIEAGANKTVVENVLTSTSTVNALSAAQGKELKAQIDAINIGMEDLGAGDMLKSVYDVDGDGKVDVAADAEKLGGQLPSYYAKAADIPTVPTVVSAFTNDAKYQTENEVASAISTATAGMATVSVVESKIATATTDMATNAGVDSKIATATTDMATNASVAEDIEEAIAPLALKSEIPTNNNQLTNGAGFQTEANVKSIVEGYGYQTAAQVEAAVKVEKDRAMGVEGGLETRLAAVEGDYLKGADKTELEGKIQSNTDAIALLTNGVDPETVDGVNDLIQYVKDHGTEVTGIKADIKANADAIDAIEADYLKAADKTELQGNIDAAVERIVANEEAIAAMVAITNDEIDALFA